MQLQTSFEAFFENQNSLPPSLKKQTSFANLKQLSQERTFTKIIKSNICSSPENKNKKPTIEETRNSLKKLENNWALIKIVHQNFQRNSHSRSLSLRKSVRDNEKPDLLEKTIQNFSTRDFVKKSVPQARISLLESNNQKNSQTERIRVKSSDNSTNLSESANQSNYFLEIFNKYSNVNKNCNSEKKTKCSYLIETPKNGKKIEFSDVNNGKNSSPKKRENFPIPIKKFNCNLEKTTGNLTKKRNNSIEKNDIKKNLDRTFTDKKRKETNTDKSYFTEKRKPKESNGVEKKKTLKIDNPTETKRNALMTPKKTSNLILYYK